MRKPILLDGIVYQTKTALKEAVQAYVRAAPIGEPLWDTFPYAIFERHPDRKEKLGVGMRHIQLNTSGWGNNRCFYVVRIDGSSIDFSWQVALKFTSSGPSLSGAAREAVYEQQIAPIAKPYSSLVVHHDGKPFVQILNEWLATLNGRMPALASDDFHSYLVDPADVQSWQAFHRQHAKLVLVTPEEHKKIHGSKKS